MGFFTVVWRLFVFVVAMAIWTLMQGCASQGHYEALLATNIGKTELDVVQRWGPPTSSYSVGDTKFLVYDDSADIGRTPGVLTGGGIYTPPAKLRATCITTLEFTNGVVTRWTLRGNSCTA